MLKIYGSLQIFEMQFSVVLKMNGIIQKENYKVAGDFEHLYIATKWRDIFTMLLSLIMIV